MQEESSVIGSKALDMARRKLDILWAKGPVELMEPDVRIGIMDAQAELRELRRQNGQQPLNDEKDEHPDLQKGFAAACEEFDITHHDFAKPGELTKALKMRLYIYAQLKLRREYCERGVAYFKTAKDEGDNEKRIKEFSKYLGREEEDELKKEIPKLLAQIWS